MSHIVSIDVKIRDLDALRVVAERLGLEFMEGQKTYKWFGRSLGDATLPEGVRKEDLGKCDHALRVRGNAEAYEAGLVRMADGSFRLMYDYWNGGYGLMEKIAHSDQMEKAGKLMQAYSTEVSRRELVRAGYRVRETTRDGRVVLSASR